MPYFGVASVLDPRKDGNGKQIPPSMMVADEPEAHGVEHLQPGRYGDHPGH